jgi:hypothetical protein
MTQERYISLMAGLADSEIMGFRTSFQKGGAEDLETIARRLEEIGAQLSNIAKAGVEAGVSGRQEALAGLKLIVRNATVEELEKLSNERAIELESAMQAGLDMLQNAADQAQLSLLESRRLQRAIEGNAREIERAQAVSRAAIEEMING